MGEHVLWPNGLRSGDFIVYLARSLSRLHVNATNTLTEVEAAFEQVTAGRDPALVASWEKESVMPQKNGKGEWESVYRLKAHWDKGNVQFCKFLCAA
jgi:hypothetical protein